MNAATLKALKGSIKKWKGIVAGKLADEGALNCDLCAMFRAKECTGCPVAERVNAPFCRDTPYLHWMREAPPTAAWFADTPERKKLAQAELDFLISLLPKKKAAAKKRRATHTARKQT